MSPYDVVQRLRYTYIWRLNTQTEVSQSRSKFVVKEEHVLHKKIVNKYNGLFLIIKKVNFLPILIQYKEGFIVLLFM